MAWFFGKKKNNQKKVLPDMEEASFAMYTREAWFRCFPDSTESQWCARGNDDAVDLAVLQNIQYLNSQGVCDINKLKEFRIITVDDEYFSWLEEKGLQDGDEERTRYISQVDDEAAERLWKKNGMGKIYTCCCLVCTLLGVDLTKNTTTHFHLSLEEQESLRSHLEKVFGQGKVWISRQFLHPSDFIHEQQEFWQEGRIWLKEGHSFSRKGFDEQQNKNPEINVLNLCLPVVVSSQYNYRINPRAVLASTTQAVAFPELCDSMGNEEWDSINEILRQAVEKTSAFVSPFLVKPAGLMDFLVKQMEFLRKNMKKARQELIREGKGPSSSERNPESSAQNAEER